MKAKASYVNSQQIKHEKNVWNIFHVNNKDAGTTIVVLSFLLLTLNIF